MEKIEKDMITIASTEYTSLLLMFELVVFESSSVDASNKKRTRNDQKQRERESGDDDA